jgi:nitric oxide reductase NorQ protein
MTKKDIANKGVLATPEAHASILEAHAAKLRKWRLATMSDEIDEIAKNIRYGNLGNHIATGIAPSVSVPQVAAIAPPDKSANDLGVAAKFTTPYVPQDGEVELLKMCIGSETNILFTGPTGCGKTHLVHHTAFELGRKVWTVQGDKGASYERVVAQSNLNASNGATVTGLTKGILPTAMEEGAILYMDEPNLIPNDVLSCMFSAMDDRHELTLENKEIIRAKKGFVVIGAMNEGSVYGGTAALSAAFRQRGVVEDLGYLPLKREVKLLKDRTGCEEAIAEKLCEAANNIRSGVVKVRTPIGTRALLNAAKLNVQGLAIEKGSPRRNC